MQIKSIVKNVENDNKFLKYEWLNHEQLIKRCKEQALKMNDLKLRSLNARRTIESLRAKQCDYKRLVNLIGTGYFGAVHRVVSVCMRNKCGVEGMVNKISNAIQGVYR
jgi:hypothetical protein